MIELKGEYNQDCKIFVDEIEEGSIRLIQSILNNEISEGVPIRIMPDTHFGKGIVIGFTMPLTKMVNPNYIGVDIGCSVTTHKLNKKINPDRFPTLDHSIRRSIPTGMNTLKASTFNNWWVENYFKSVNDNIQCFQKEWEKRTGTKKESVIVDTEYITQLCKKIEILESQFYYSIGTLGGGNHFIEFGESENDGSHFVTIHSGSRHFGLKICNYHAKKMTRPDSYPMEYHNEVSIISKNTFPKTDIPKKLKELRKRYMIGRKEFFLQDEDMYDYLLDMVIAQTYAQTNHRVMTKAIFKDLGADYEAIESIHTMHNFIDTTDWMIRKGAIRSYLGEKMVIPFNMRDGILICEGKSNADWNYSAPHGAGRLLARNKAFKVLNITKFEKQMNGIYSTSITKRTLDESPMAYKDKEFIKQAIQETTTIIDSIRPIMNLKDIG